MPTPATNTKIENAKITSTRLGTEDHGMDRGGDPQRKDWTMSEKDHGAELAAVGNDTTAAAPERQAAPSRLPNGRNHRCIVCRTPCDCGIREWFRCQSCTRCEDAKYLPEQDGAK